MDLDLTAKKFSDPETQIKMMREAMENQGEKKLEFDRLPDPLGDRVMKEVPLPPLRPMSVTQLFPQFIQFGDIAPPNYKAVRELLVLDGRIEKKALIKLIKNCQTILAKDSNLVSITGQVVMVGDIHG